MLHFIPTLFSLSLSSTHIHTTLCHSFSQSFTDSFTFLSLFLLYILSFIPCCCFSVAKSNTDKTDDYSHWLHKFIHKFNINRSSTSRHNFVIILLLFCCCCCCLLIEFQKISLLMILTLYLHRHKIWTQCFIAMSMKENYRIKSFFCGTLLCVCFISTSNWYDFYRKKIFKASTLEENG